MDLFYSMEYQGGLVSDYTKDLKLANRGHMGLSQEKKRGDTLYIKRCYANDPIGNKELEKFRLKIQLEGSGMAELTEQAYTDVA
jgi:hypothetical protein